MELVKIKNQYQSEFVKLIKSFNGKFYTWEIFADFIVMFACAISNAVDKIHAEAREKMYLQVINRYEEDERNIFPQMCATVVKGMEADKNCDFLGEIYMSLGLGDHWKGQFFTPYSVCKVMAELTGRISVEQIKKDGYITVNDPACGAGALLIAYANTAEEKLKDSGYNWQNHVLLTAQDVDMITGLMCYIQLSLIGCAGYVKIGDSLADPITVEEARNELLKTKSNYWYTPMYFSDVWQYRWFFRSLDRLNIAPKREEQKKDVEDNREYKARMPEFSEDEDEQMTLL